jgi:hypothetical protein
MKISYILFILYNLNAIKLDKGAVRTENEISNIAVKFINEYSKSFNNPNSKIILTNSDKANNSKLNNIENNFIANYIYLEDRNKNGKDLIYFK